MLLLAAAAILGGVVVVAMGRGGEMAIFSSDAPIAVARFRTPADLATVRLPLGPIGYRVQATEEALSAAAATIQQRDAEIAQLRGELAGSSAVKQQPKLRSTVGLLSQRVTSHERYRRRRRA